MKQRSPRSGITRRAMLSTAASLPLLSLPQIRTSWAQTNDPLPSWNNELAKQTIIAFVGYR